MAGITKKEKGIAAVADSNLYEFSRDLILNSRKVVYQAANFAMVETYWRIGEKIVEEQSGEAYAKYGESLLKGVSERLQAEFGKGLAYASFTSIRKLYIQRPNISVLWKELCWAH